MEIQQIGVLKESKRTPNSQEQVKARSTKKPKLEKSEMIEVVNLEDVDVDVDIDAGEFFFTPVSKRGSTKRSAISVEQYTEERDLNLAIVASLKSTPNCNMELNFVDLSHEYQNHFFNVDDYDDNDDYDVRVLNFRPLSTTSVAGRNRFRESMTEKGQSSKSNDDPEFTCGICFEPKTKDESFSIKGCTHSYCTDCMTKYVASKLQENISSISCPVSGCSSLLEPEYCRSILPQAVFDRWGNALCEAVILGSQKFYCPYKDCSVMLIDDGGESIRESECPNCRRLFCAQCRVPWHAGIECLEFQKLHKDEREREDIMLMKLAQDKQWRRCPNCRIFVERTIGCKYMLCRCGASFCYGCGTMSISRGSHFCSYCKG